MSTTWGTIHYSGTCILVGVGMSFVLGETVEDEEDGSSDSIYYRYAADNSQGHEDVLLLIPLLLI
jgi:hypothetical protein